MRFLGAAVLGLFVLEWSSSAQAQSITVNSGETVGSQFLLGDGQQGLVRTDGTVITFNDAEDAFSLLDNGQSLTIQGGGTVSTQGDFAFPVFSQGVGNSVDNAGLIIGAGDNTAGIAVSGNSTTVSNTGLISMQGAAFALGIVGTGSDLQVSNRGTIETASAGGIGILALGPRANLANEGSIAADGAGSLGILSDSTDAAIANSGNISAQGPGGTAILANGNNAFIRNSGGLYSNLLSTAVILSGDDSTLLLEPGSRIQGDVVFVGLNDHLVIGSGLNTALSMTSLPATIDTSGMPAVVSGDTLATVDPTGLLTLSAGTHEVGLSVQRIIEEHDDNAPVRALWIKSFGSDRTLESQTTGVEFDSSVGGLVAGMDGEISQGLRIGGFAAIAASDGSTERRGWQSSGRHFAGGIYGKAHMSETFVDAFIQVGSSQMESRRNIANNTVIGGLETGRADVEGRFVNPAMTIGHHLDVGSLTITPSLSASYNAIFLDGFSEGGTVAALGLSKRRADMLDIRAQVELETQLIEMQTGVATAGLRFGLDAGWQRLRGSSAAQLMSQDISMPDLDENTLRAFAGMGVNYMPSNGLTLQASAEAGVGKNGDIGAAGRISIIADAQ